jgi:hypothetical protein
MLWNNFLLLQIAAMAAKARRVSERPPFECIALLLQGGGALGSYQAGVYAALAQAELQPDWVAGISIGAINAASSCSWGTSFATRGTSTSVVCAGAQTRGSIQNGAALKLFAIGT